MAKLAFYTCAILEESHGNPHSKGFTDRVPSVFESAEEAEGFVDRAGSRYLETQDSPWGDPGASPRFTAEQREARIKDDSVTTAASDGSEAATVLIWDDLESVYAFAYNGRHMEALKKRSEWFVNLEWPTYIAWWVEDGETPTREDPASQLEHLDDKGSTPHAFDFKAPFDAAGTPWKMHRSKIQERAKTVKAFDEDNPQNL